MSGLGFVSYRVDLDKALKNTLDRAVAASLDLRPVFRTVARDFYKSRQAIFSLKGPGKYPPFKGPTIAQTWQNPGRPKARTRDGSKTPYQFAKLKRYGFDYPLLKATGKLESSITKLGGEGNVTVIGKSSLILGTGVPYAIYHQSDEPRSKIPLRKFLFIGPEGKDNGDYPGGFTRIANQINTYILRAGGASPSESRG